MMLPTIELTVSGYSLRAWQGDDAANLALHANNLAVWRNMSDRFPHPYTLEVAQHWVEVGHVDFGGDNWAIACNGEAIGGCGLHGDSNQFLCNTEIGYWIAEKYWGKGVGSAVVEALTAQAFANPEVTRVYAPIHAHNAASQRVCEKNGFVREGLLRKSALKAGEVIDRVLWAIYRDVWEAKCH